MFGLCLLLDFSTFGTAMILPGLPGSSLPSAGLSPVPSRPLREASEKAAGVLAGMFSVG